VALNLLKLELRYSNPLRNARTTNESENRPISLILTLKLVAMARFLYHSVNLIFLSVHLLTGVFFLCNCHMYLPFVYVFHTRLLCVILIKHDDDDDDDDDDGDDRKKNVVSIIYDQIPTILWCTLVQ